MLAKILVYAQQLPILIFGIRMIVLFSLKLTGLGGYGLNQRFKARFHYEVCYEAYEACKDTVNDCWMSSAAQGDHVQLFQYKVAKTVSTLAK